MSSELQTLGSFSRATGFYFQFVPGDDPCLALAVIPPRVPCSPWFLVVHSREYPVWVGFHIDGLPAIGTQS